VTGSAPRHLVVRVDGLVLCPEGSRAYQDCFRCPALQGTLEGAELVMLCGHGAPAPPLRFAAVTMDRPVPLADAPVPAHRR
jgi:hypothetical protein